MQLQRHLKVLLRALGERFDRLDRLEQRIDDVRKEFQERFDRLENLLASDKRTFDPGARVADPSLSGTDAHSDSLDAALARVSDLEALVKSSHRLTMEALAGTTSGTMLNRVDQRLEAVANELHGGVGRIDSRIDEAYVALMKAITGLPSATLIRELPDGVVATGTMLDDELMEVRRTLTDRALTNTENSGQPPGPPVSPTEPG